MCDCDGKIITVREESLLSGRTKSCGCYKDFSNKQKRKFNTYIQHNNEMIGYTENDEEFYFDTEDFEKIKNYYWNIHNSYVEAWDEDKRISMHRLIMNPSDDKVVDHINHINHDNRKINLRICSIKENTMNEKLAINNTSGKTGVCFEKSTGNWRAYINIDNKSVKLGVFNSFDEALRARLLSEKDIFGDYRNKEQEETWIS